MIYYNTIQTQFGPITYFVQNGKLIRLLLPGAHKEPNSIPAKKDSQLLPALKRKLQKYFSGQNVSFDDIYCDISNLPLFTQKVLNKVKEIKFGQIVTYKELAKKIGHPQAYRAVGNALRKNPIPIIIPCHRVIKSNGAIGGFMGNSSNELKKNLLLLEKVKL